MKFTLAAKAVASHLLSKNRTAQSTLWQLQLGSRAASPGVCRQLQMESRGFSRVNMTARFFFDKPIDLRSCGAHSCQLSCSGIKRVREWQMKASDFHLGFSKPCIIPWKKLQRRTFSSGGLWGFSAPAAALPSRLPADKGGTPRELSRRYLAMAHLIRAKGAST